MTFKPRLATLSLLMILGACGKVGPLEPKAGQAPPAKAYGQSEAPTTNDLLKPSIQARPGRSDELLRRSERRASDPFDLPPGEKAPESKPAPEPSKTNDDDASIPK
jgi:predicted small lipoprotein YifL